MALAHNISQIKDDFGLLADLQLAVRRLEFPRCNVQANCSWQAVTHSQLRWVARPHAPAALPLGEPQSPSGRFGEDVCRESNPDKPSFNQFNTEWALLAPFRTAIFVTATNKQ